MKLYVDTNVYLSYVNTTSDIKSLSKLKKAVKDGIVQLVLPSQTKIEFLRNFKDRVTQARNKIDESKVEFVIPNELKDAKKKKYTKEEEGIIKSIDALNAAVKKYRANKAGELKRHIDAVEKLINEIFDLADFFEYTDEVVMRAVVRYAKGLPPKKENFKFGDAIIWETLKENIRGEELVIISADSDFSEKGKTDIKINTVLDSEWKKHTKKKISLFSVLGQFMNTVDKKDLISDEIIKKEKRQLSSAYMEGYREAASKYNLSAESGKFTLLANESNLSCAPGPLHILKNLNVGGGVSVANTPFLSPLHEPTILFGYVCKICHKNYNPRINVGIGDNGLCPDCDNFQNYYNLVRVTN